MNYYTPNIEDIRVGYECEWVEAIPEFQTGRPSDWSILKVNYLDSRWFSRMLSEEAIRTPYLTKEQIEAEGWMLKESNWVKEDYQMLTGTVISDGVLVSKPCHIMKGDRTVYEGQCRCINELRMIQKLLKIK